MSSFFSRLLIGSLIVAAYSFFGTLNLTMLNNKINGCEGTGFSSYAPHSIDPWTLNISGNTISNCQNLSGNGASGIDIEQYVNLVGSITNNTFSGNADPDVAVGIYSNIPSPTVCLTLTGNSSTNEYVLTNPGAGTFNLSPCNVNDVNVGTISPQGSINMVQSCPGAPPCPP